MRYWILIILACLLCVLGDPSVSNLGLDGASQGVLLPHPSVPYRYSQQVRCRSHLACARDSCFMALKVKRGKGPIGIDWNFTSMASAMMGDSYQKEGGLMMHGVARRLHGGTTPLPRRPTCSPTGTGSWASFTPAPGNGFGWRYTR